MWPGHPPPHTPGNYQEIFLETIGSLCLEVIVLGGPRVGSLLQEQRGGPTSICLEFSTHKRDSATWSESSSPSPLTTVSGISQRGGPGQFPG